jgi:hypothetical protein
LSSSIYKPIWSIGLIPVKTVAAFSGEPQVCPDELLGLKNSDFVKFEIPPYQRGLVWKQKKVKEFINSLSRGWPIGAIVLTRIESDNQDQFHNRRVTTWQVIDGQQRLAAISQIRKNFWKEPWYNLDSEALKDPLINLSRIYEITPQDTKACIELMTQGDATNPFNIETLEDNWWFLNKFDRAGSYDKNLDPQSSEGKLAENASLTIRKNLLAQFTEFDEIEIAVIAITPENSSALEARNISSQIFERLNSGIKLDRYDILAATWSRIPVPWKEYLNENSNLTNTTLLNKATKNWMFIQMKTRIQSTYEENSEELQIDPSIEELSEEEVSFFDFLYALSRLTRVQINSESRGTFNVAERTAFPDQKFKSKIAFDVSALLFAGGLGVKSDENLPQLFPTQLRRQIDNEFAIQTFSEFYLNAVQEIGSHLSKYMSQIAKGNRKTTLGAIQASVYIASYLNTVHDLEISRDGKWIIQKRGNSRNRTSDGIENFSASQRLSRFRKNLPAWWIYHTISDYFQGSNAYVNASASVWKEIEVSTSDNRIVRKQENDFLLWAPKLQQLLEALRLLFIQEAKVDKAPTSRSPSQAATALFFVIFNRDNMSSYDMDHVVAWRGQEARTNRLEKPIALNHVANWLPLDPTLNRSRQNVPWAQFIMSVSSTDKDKIQKELFISVDKLNSDLNGDVKKFQQYLLIRWVGMIDALLRNINLSEYTDLTNEEKRSVLIEQVLNPIIKSLELIEGEIDAQIFGNTIFDQVLFNR